MNFLFKLSLGLGVVAGYLIFTKRINEVKRFEIRGITTKLTIRINFSYVEFNIFNDSKFISKNL